MAPEQLKKIGIDVAPIQMGASKLAPKPAVGAPARMPFGLNLLPGAGNNRIFAIVPKEGYPQMGTGKELYLAHKNCMQNRKIEILYETPARELIQNPLDKSIQGVVAERQGKKIFVKARRANEHCQAGKDADFKRRPENLYPVATPPYYAAELALTVTNTQGGPKHNGKAQTLNKDNQPIPRLYAAGEFGSFFGFLYPGGSNIPEAIAFGRIAGENAAAEKPWV